jgi:hypothetical protein
LAVLFSQIAHARGPGKGYGALCSIYGIRKVTRLGISGGQCTNNWRLLIVRQVGSFLG